MAGLQVYFLSPGSAERLGWTRVLFYAWLGFQVFAYAPWQYAQLPASSWEPVLLMGAFAPPSGPLLLGFSVLLLSTSFLACIGLYTRAATWGAFLSSVWVLGAVSSYGHVGIHFQPLIFLSGILAFSPCGDAVSVDARRRAPAASDAADYCWPLRLGQIAFAGLMFTAGCQKLAGNWLSQPIHNMEYWLKHKYFVHARAKGFEISDAVLWASDQPWLLCLMALAILAEVLSPLLLVDRWKLLRFGILGALFVMQASLALVLKTLPTFPWLGAYFFFVPWERVIARASKR